MTKPERLAKSDFCHSDQLISDSSLFIFSLLDIVVMKECEITTLKYDGKACRLYLLYLDAFEDIILSKTSDQAARSLKENAFHNSCWASELPTCIQAPLSDIKHIVNSLQARVKK